MDIKQVQKYIGKKVIIVLKNNFTYTTVLPEFEGSNFTITDRYGDTVEISVDYIAFMKVAKAKTSGGQKENGRTNSEAI